MKNLKRALTNNACAHDKNVHTGCACETANELTLTAIDGKHRLKSEKRALLTCCLAVGRTESVSVLSSESDALALKNSVNLLRMSCGVNTTENNLVFSHKRILNGSKLLNLSNHIAACPNFLSSLYDLSACLSVLLIGEASHLTAIVLRPYLVAGSNDSSNLSGSGNYSKLALIDVLQNTVNHCFLLLV